jgi:foldase protein PrsA
MHAVREIVRRHPLPTSPSRELSMSKAVRLLLAVCALAAVTAVAAGCGGGSSASIPGNAIATVDGNTVDKAQFDHWMTIVAKSSGQPSAVVPDPPSFQKCVAAKRKSTPKPGKGQPKVTDAQLKTQCQSEYNTLRDQVVGLLVTYRWVQGEADQRNVSVSQADVQKSFQQQKKQSFPKAADYQKFLKQSGQTQGDILLRVKVDLLFSKIRDQILKGKDNVTDAQVTAFYNKNKSRFSTPETRDLDIVLTKTKAKAAQARKAIASGQSWASVAKKYSIDQASKSQGGKLPGQAKGSLEKSLDSAVFSAKKGALTGPVKTQFGFYDFKVVKIHPAQTQSLNQAKATIKQTLASQNQQKALNDYIKSFQSRWRAKTECRKGYTTSDCSNGPKPTPTAAGGAEQPTG